MAHFYLHGESSWKLAIACLALALFFGLGLAHVLYPGYFLRRSAIRKGGAMLNGFNREGIRIVGIVLALLAAGVHYDLGRELLTK
jgi:hypothetical protein